MYRNIWEMYGKNILIEFFKMTPPLDLNLMYSKVLELEELYHFAKKHFQIHKLGFEYT